MTNNEQKIQYQYFGISISTKSIFWTPSALQKSLLVCSCYMFPFIALFWFCVLPVWINWVLIVLVTSSKYMETGTMSFPRFKVPLVIYVSRDLPILVRTNLCQHAVILPWLSGGALISLCTLPVDVLVLFGLCLRLVFKSVKEKYHDAAVSMSYSVVSLV